MEAIGGDGGQVLVRDARESVLVNEVPVGVCCGTGQQSQLVVGQRAADGVLACACIIGIVALQGISKDDNDIVLLFLLISTVHMGC